MPKKETVMIFEEKLTKEQAERIVERLADVFYDLGWETPDQYGKAQDVFEDELEKAEMAEKVDGVEEIFKLNMELLIQTASDLEDAASGRG